MAIDLTFLRSKVAQRIFLLFVLCALLPIAALSIVSFTLVTRQLNSESQDRLSQESKAQGMSIYERLRFVEAEMRIIGANPGAVRAMSKAFPQELEERFSGLAIAAEDSALQPIFGDIREFPDLTDAEWEHLDSGKSVVSTSPSTDTGRRVFMLRLVDPEERTKEILVGEINPAYLWGQDTMPASTELSVVGETGDLLVSSSTAPPRLHERLTDRSRRSASGRFEWNDGRERYLSSYWSLFLKPTFFVAEWTIVLSESRADALAATANFKAMFPVIIVMSVSVVLLLSLTQIRKHLVPLEKLREGTDRIARKDFTSRVLVTSGDEFEDLAKSFNVMAARLGQQFNALKTINKIDSAILSTLETEEIVRTVLTQMRTLIRRTGVSVHLFDFDDPRKARTYLEGIDGDGDLVVETTTLTDEEAEELRDNPESLLISDISDVATPSYVEAMARHGMRSFLVLPIVLKEELSGIICLGYLALRGLSQEDVQQVRQVADQVAVALSNARLIEELDQLNWGALRALARAIDAKSPWTSGHSERVTEMALKIGRVMNLSAKELDILHRGGLLHDIGKIGTPVSILDKPARLTDEEYGTMRDHVRIGARILEPIAAFADALPIVLEHHEWFNGKGYPAGLAGEQISLGGRIFGVADVFDAVTSARPYRSGMPPQKAIDLITNDSGRQFDPKVVQAFLKVMSQEEGRSQADTAQDRSTAAPGMAAGSLTM